MRLSHTEWLACPRCATEVSVLDGSRTEVDAGVLKCAGGHHFAVRDGIARFTSDDSSPPPLARTLIEGEHARLFWRARLDRLLPERHYAGRTVLELGGGDGRHALWLARTAAHVTILDPRARIAWGREAAGDRANTLFVQGELARPPLARRRYDLVVISVPVTRGLLTAAVRLLRAGGDLVVFAGRSRARGLARGLASRLPAPLLESLCALGARSTGGGNWQAARLADYLSQPPVDRGLIVRSTQQAGLQLIETRGGAVRWRKSPFPGAAEARAPAGPPVRSEAWAQIA